MNDKNIIEKTKEVKEIAKEIGETLSIIDLIKDYRFECDEELQARAYSFGEYEILDTLDISRVRKEIDEQVEEELKKTQDKEFIDYIIKNLKQGFVEYLVGEVISECCILNNYIYKEDIDYYIENVADEKEAKRLKEEIEEVREELGMTEPQLFEKLGQALSQEIIDVKKSDKTIHSTKTDKTRELIRNLRELIDDTWIMTLEEKYEEVIEKTIIDYNNGNYIYRSIITDMIQEIYICWKNLKI